MVALAEVVAQVVLLLQVMVALVAKLEVVVEMAVMEAQAQSFFIGQRGIDYEIRMD